MTNALFTYFLRTTPSSLAFLFNLLQAWVHINLAGFFLCCKRLLALEEPNSTGYTKTKDTKRRELTA
jgi:hypothetical protein